MAITITRPAADYPAAHEWLTRQLRALQGAPTDAGTTRERPARSAPEVIDVEAQLVDVDARDAARENARLALEAAALAYRQAPAVMYQPAAGRGVRLVHPNSSPGRILNVYA